MSFYVGGAPNILVEHRQADVKAGLGVLQTLFFLLNASEQDEGNESGSLANHNIDNALDREVRLSCGIKDSDDGVVVDHDDYGRVEELAIGFSDAGIG